MTKKAVLFRMVIDDHACPYGVKARDLLLSEGYEIDETILDNRPDVDAFKDKHGVRTTPQTFIDGKRIGGYDDLCEYFGVGKKN